MLTLPHVLVLAVVMPGLMLQTAADGNIPEIHINKLITKRTSEGSGFSVTWDPIQTTVDNDPVLGIKVKAWKTPCVIRSFYNISENGTSRVVKSEVQSYNSTTVPDELPQYVAIVKADELIAKFPRVERGLWYHVRALAFTGTAEGTHSNSYDFMLTSDNEEDKKRSCERVISETPCKSMFISPYTSPDDC